MTDDQKNRQPNDAHPGDITRRDFTALLVGAGLVATTTVQSATAVDLEVVEADVEIKTPDGTCDAAFIHPHSHPKTGSYPGVLVWPDAFGLRPSMRAIARRIAAEGYSVLVPNPFYRVAKAPFSDASSFNFQNPDDRAKLKPLMESVSAPGNAEKDAAAYVAFLDAQKEVNQGKKIGTQGYCMGGALVVRTAAALPIALARARRSTAGAWSPTNPIARICSRRRSRLACISASRRTTTRVSRMPRTS
jgi:carboxymethylenebutenolidase